MKEKIKILIADDHPVFRRGLSLVVSSAKNIEIVGEAENGEIALKLVETVKPDIVILDIDMPVLDGIHTAKILHKNYPLVKIIFLSMHKDKEILNSLKRLNVKGYVIKDSAVLEIVECIEQVAEGKIFISPDISGLIKERIDKQPVNNFSAPFISKLTTTELRILQYICESKTNRDISEEMFLSIRTVENHRFNICTKLTLRGNHALLKFAIENKETILPNSGNE